MSRKKPLSRAARIFRAFAFALLAATAGVLLFLFLAPLTERRDPAPIPGSSDWMSRLDDALPLNRIALPGTHDSGAQFAQLAYFSKCQASDIRTQLDDGFRYLDIRLGVTGEGEDTRALFYHGFCRCRTGFFPWAPALDLETALQDCYGFLEEHPSETVLFTVKQEQGEDTAALQALLDKAIRQDPDKWLLTGRIPTLGEARGRLVLVRRYEDKAGLGDRSGLFLDWPDQGGRTDTGAHASSVELPWGRLLVQDRYKYETGEKWTAFLAGLAAGSQETDELRLHFLSTNGSPKFGHPFSYAKTLNLFLEAEDLSAYPPSWIIVDFSDAGLACAVYSRNFR